MILFYTPKNPSISLDMVWQTSVLQLLINIRREQRGIRGVGKTEARE